MITFRARGPVAIALTTVVLLVSAASANAAGNSPAAGAADGGGSVSTQAVVPIGGAWQTFRFGDEGSPVSSCGCSGGGDSVDPGDPPYTFDALTPVTLTVTDAYVFGDRFEVFDFGVSLGQTSVPTSGECDGDPAVCVATPGVSKRAYGLAAGPHSITIVVTVSPYGGGLAYFRTDVATAACELAMAPAAGCWKFDEAGGSTALDASGNANDGTYLGGVTLAVPGALAGDPGTAASLDGVNDSVRVSDSGSLDVGDSFSLEAWVKRASTGKSQELMNKGGNGFQLTVMSQGSGNQVFLRKANVTTIARSSVGVPADGRYHHIVATKNGTGAGSAKIYVDGINVTVPLAPLQAVVDTAFPLTFGGPATGAGAGSGQASYDQFGVYDGVLTATQVAARAALTAP